MSDLLNYSLAFNNARKNIALPFRESYARAPFNSMVPKNSEIPLPVVLPPLNLTEHNLTNFATITTYLGQNVDFAKHRLSNASQNSQLPSVRNSDFSETGSVSSHTLDSEGYPSQLPSSIGDYYNESKAVQAPKADHVHDHQLENNDDQPNRRQRTGPSCDACRSSKVKCNASIDVLGRIEDLRSGSISEITSELSTKLLTQQEPVFISGVQYLISNDKVIKFKGCQFCLTKKSDCYFSKGYTKEDMINNRKPSVSSSKSATLANKVSKKKRVGVVGQKSNISSSRKSSCLACRKRKVKCIFNGSLKKCEGCLRKNLECFHKHSLLDSSDDGITSPTVKV